MTTPRIPLPSLVLGYGPVLILPACAIAAWTGQGPVIPAAIGIGQLWAAAILLFLAGVRRGLSFFTDGGPRPVQLATTIWLFLLGIGGLVAPIDLALVLLIVGYGSVALLDPRAAPRGEVPAHFARLRPPQMAVAVAGLAGLLAVVLRG